MTECTQSTFAFAAHFSRQVVAGFDGGTITTDAGGLLLRETDRRLKLLPRLAKCFVDVRSPILVEHSVEQLVAQRVYGLALGYEDLNDHEQLRQDPLLRVLAGKSDVEDSPLAGKSTLNRVELSDGKPSRYKKVSFVKEAIDELLVQVFLESYGTAPTAITLDVDATDLPLHGKQEGRFFHGVGARPMEWITCLDWRAINGCAGSSGRRCGRPRSNGIRRANRHVCLRSSPIRPERGRRKRRSQAVGIANGV